MAMKEPNSWVVGFEAKNDKSVGGYYFDVALGWYAGEGAFITVP
jgi:hypothetical protein